MDKGQVHNNEEKVQIKAELLGRTNTEVQSAMSVNVSKSIVCMF